MGSRCCAQDTAPVNDLLKQSRNNEKLEKESLINSQVDTMVEGNETENTFILLFFPHFI